MIAAARWLRIDGPSWDRIDVSARMSTAAVNGIGAYLLLAFDRFGFQGFQSPRGPTRLLLIGVYGWLGLSAAMWLVARWRGRDAEFVTVFRFVGYAHMPLLLVGIVLQMTAITLRWFGPGLIASIFALGFWFPALLVAGVRKATGTHWPEALFVVAAPYGVWLATVGVVLFVQLGHLI